MQRTIITSNGEKIIDSGSVTFPSEGGLQVNFSVINDEGYAKSDNTLIGPNPITEEIANYILDKIEEMYATR